MKKYFCYIIAMLLVSLPTVASAGSIEPFADLLVWKAAETNSSWATTIAFSPDATHVIQSSPNFATHTGVRTGFSYSPTDSFWDTKLYWTYFSSNAKKSIPVNLQLVTSLFFSGSYFISKDIFFGGGVNWNILMNMFDLEISHAFQPTPSLAFAPRIGVKTGSINQAIHINWDAVVYQANEKLNNNFFGAGPSFGINAKWNFLESFSFVTDLATAIMYGRWNEDDIYQRPLSLFTTPTTISTNATHQKLGTMMMDYYLGLEWRHQGKSTITARVGYEMQYWPSQLRLLAIQQLPTFGDLTLQGATCGVSIEL